MMNAQQAADFLSESPQHEISRHKAHIKILEEALTMKRESYKELQAQNAALLEALENLLRCSEYKATDYCQDCVPAANEAIRKAQQ